VLQACKGEEEEMQLDQDKKGSLKAKSEVCSFFSHGICGRLY
jgi:hypothetical protein